MLLLLVAGACGVPPAPTSSLAVERQSVLGGVFEPGSPAVGALVPVSPLCGEPDEASPVMCTGTLVAPRVVLTAAHCVESPDVSQVLSVVFSPESARALPAERVRVIEGRLHPAFNAVENDIGVLILAEDAPVAPVPLSGLTLPADVVGRSTRVVGFGLDDEGRTGMRRSGTARVTAVEPGTFSIEASPGMSCGGDSGGPLFLDIDGAERLAGITSYGDPSCTRGINMRVDVHAAFLQASLDDVARAPPSRPPFEPSVDACTAHCEGHADCPLGMACVPRPGGAKSCAVAGLEAGRFGADCTGPEGERLCVKAGGACRLWLPCNEPEPEPELELGGGGCAVTRDSGGSGTVFAVLLALVARAARSRMRRQEGSRSPPPGAHAAGCHAG
ncbi:trypsin-like serine protease [Archangium gephyra]|uniref:S1 family peptidase n=1 Tax=Archangium gephyra TaxID=48 RepID=UPI0035D445AB